MPRQDARYLNSLDYVESLHPLQQANVYHVNVHDTKLGQHIIIIITNIKNQFSFVFSNYNSVSF